MLNIIVADDGVLRTTSLIALAFFAVMITRAFENWKNGNLRIRTWSVARSFALAYLISIFVMAFIRNQIGEAIVSRF